MRVGAIVALQTKEGLDAAHRATASAVLVQLGSASCALCPAFGAAVDALEGQYQFDRYYCDVAGEECDLLEEFGVRRLPALLLRARGDGGEWVVRTGCTPAELEEAVSAACTPVLKLDEDF